MAPRLYMVDSSPPVRAVLMVAKAIGLELEIKEINVVEQEQLQPEFLKINPQHTVPTLVDGNLTIWDSHAIIPYLIATYAKNDDLYPQDPKKRAVIDQRMHFESETIFGRTKNIVRPIIFEGKKTICQKDEDLWNEGLAFLNTFLENYEWVAGNSVSAADYSIFSSVSSMNTVLPIDSVQFPKVVKWLNKMGKLPASQENVKGLALFSVLVESKLE